MSATSVAAFSTNMKQIIHLSKEEKSILATRLQAELQEFRERERLYLEKREELVDLERQYRKRQDAIVGNQGKYKSQIKTNDLIIKQLLEQIEQDRQTLEQRDIENDDMHEKISTQRAAITKREDELTELRDKISAKATKSEELRCILDKLAMQQKILIEERKQDEEEIEHLKEIREMRHQENEDYTQKLRKVKNDHFNGTEKLGQINSVKEQKLGQLEYLEQELHRVQNRLGQSKEQYDLAQTEKYELENTIKVQSQEISNLTNQKRLLEESNRRLSTGVSDLRKKLADADALLMKMEPEFEDLRANNRFREEENQQLQEDLQILDEHLGTLEKQNKELERELESFTHSDDLIQEKLRSRSRSPSPKYVPTRTPAGKGGDYEKSGHFKRSQNSMASTKLGQTGFKPGEYPTASKFTAEKDINPSLFGSIGLDSSVKKTMPLRNFNNEGGLLSSLYKPKAEKENDNKVSAFNPLQSTYMPLRDRSRSPSLESHLNMRTPQQVKRQNPQQQQQVYLNQDSSPSDRHHYNPNGQQQNYNQSIYNQNNNNNTRNNQQNSLLDSQYQQYQQMMTQQQQQQRHHQLYSQSSSQQLSQNKSVSTLQPRVRERTEYDQSAQKLSRITEQEEVMETPQRGRRWSPLRGLLKQRLQGEQ